MKFKRIIWILPALLLGALNANSQAGELRVTGEASVKAVPEILSITIPLNAKEDTYDACNQSLMRSYNKLADALQKAGIDKHSIKSSGMQINQSYTWVDRERKPDGFTGSMNLSLKMPYTHKSLNAFTRTMSDKSFDFGYQLGFELSETQKSKITDEAIKSAVEDAKRKGEMLAEAAGVRKNFVKEITYGSEDRGFSPLMLRDGAKMAMEVEEIDLNPNLIEIKQKVTIVWNISP
jgi:uncharacterized protein YggE